MQNFEERMNYYVECEEIYQEDLEIAKNIEFYINEEDVVLFIQGMRGKLNSIKSVSYSPMETEYDGAYQVSMKDGTVKYYGWLESDTCPFLYPIN